MKPDNSAELLQEVRRQMSDGKFSRAFATLKELLARNPSHQEGRRLLATLLLKFGNHATAKNAFETLVKEAVQRSDYAEAESLLHEYLMAGPRCVSFIEMLGAVYEAKGDGLAAVFEYEKAIDLLLEDPDQERPTYAEDLFQKIKRLAPSSFVANRVAARLQRPTMAQSNASALPQAPAEWDGSEEETPMTASAPSEPIEDVEAKFEPVERETEDNEVEEHSAAVDPDELEWSSEVHQQAVVQSAAPVMPQVYPTPDEKVPFPPVNTPPNNQIALKTDDKAQDEGPDTESGSEPDGFGNEPVSHRSSVEFYLEGSENVRSTSDNAPVTSLKQTFAGQEAKPFTDDDDHVPSHESYWKRATGGTDSRLALSYGQEPPTAVPVQGNVTNDSDVTARKHQYNRDAALWLSSRLSIVSRRLITATNSVTKLVIFVSIAITLWTALIIGGAASLWIGVEQTPSAAFQHLVSVAPPKTIEDWRKNGYILLMGFGAAPSMDPMQVGYDRWLTPQTGPAQGCPVRTKGQSVARAASVPPTSADSVKASDSSSRFLADWLEGKEHIDPQDQLASRYRRWLSLPFEDWGFNYLGTPDCEHILAVHRLYLAEGFSQSVTAGLDRLESDLTAWRKVLAQARTLSAKSMAAEGIGDDLTVMSGLLNRETIESKAVQRLTRIARPLDPEERSLRWPMQNEFALVVKRMDSRVHPHPDTDPSLAVAIAKMPLPKQRTLNMYAAYYEALIKAAGLPHASMPKLYDFANTPSRTWLDYGYNPIDNLIVADPTPDWEAMAGAIMETDARLRLAGLQARLRAPSQDSSLVTRIAQAGPNFYDPFTELPMLVNATRGVMYSVGMDHKDDGGDPTFDVSVPFLH